MTGWRVLMAEVTRRGGVISRDDARTVLAAVGIDLRAVGALIRDGWLVRHGEMYLFTPKRNDWAGDLYEREIAPKL